MDTDFELSLWTKPRVKDNMFSLQASIQCESGCSHDSYDNQWIWYDRSRKIVGSESVCDSNNFTGSQVAGLATGLLVLGLLIGVALGMLAARNGYNLLVM